MTTRSSPARWERMANELREEADKLEEGVIWRQQRIANYRGAADELTTLARELREREAPEETVTAMERLTVTTGGLTETEAEQLAYSTQQGHQDGEAVTLTGAERAAGWLPRPRP